MKAINIFTNLTGQVLGDDHIQKYGAILLRSGPQGVRKIHPAVVWVDAAFAVIEAAGAYFNYCTAAEGTKQLHLLNRKLEKILANELQIEELKLRELLHEQKTRQAHIERALRESRTQGQFTKKKIRQQLDTLQHMLRLLQEQRLQSGGFQELVALQVILDNCVDATLSLLLNLDE